ncbi:MAG: CopG family transcriptional regulator [Candidatus Cloacimonetes bacterium]|nr:CopG family transcriptional regulator [Candidatus Cloacimonadota bacterium]
MCKKKREEVISFKVDEELGRQLKDIPNRSEFIRSAIALALKRVCPLCHGQGSLSDLQKMYLDDFLKDHRFVQADEDKENVLICSHRAEHE